MKGVAYMDKKLSELTVREALALITVFAKVLNDSSLGASVAQKKYQSALDEINKRCDADGDK